jgi:hypothetical protein
MACYVCWLDKAREDGLGCLWVRAWGTAMPGRPCWREGMWRSVLMGGGWLGGHGARREGGAVEDLPDCQNVPLLMGELVGRAQEIRP